MHGRDKFFRPCIVYDPYVIERIKNEGNQEINFQALLIAAIYIFEYVRNNMLAPSRVENWVVLCTVNKLSMNKLPIRELKPIAE